MAVLVTSPPRYLEAADVEDVLGFTPCPSTNPAISGGALTETDVSAAMLTPMAEGALAQIMAILHGETFVVPDWFYGTADGADDAPSIRRATATGKPVHFRPRHYAIRSPSTFTTRVSWHGAGWQELGVLAGVVYGGTWLEIDASFQQSAPAGSNDDQYPFTITGFTSTGTVVEDLAFRQPQTLPAPGTAVWTPNVYAHVFNVIDTYGSTRFRNVFFYGVYNGINCVNSGRFEVDGFNGHFFNNGLTIDTAYDVCRLRNVRSAPMWGDNVAVEQYQQANLDVVVLGRCDTVQIDGVFGIFGRSGIRFTNFGNGVTTGAKLNGLSFDFTRSGLWCDAAAVGVTFTSDSKQA